MIHAFIEPVPEIWEVKLSKTLKKQLVHGELQTWSQSPWNQN